jgi:hypothetical protein
VNIDPGEEISLGREESEKRKVHEEGGEREKERGKERERGEGEGEGGEEEGEERGRGKEGKRREERSRTERRFQLGVSREGVRDTASYIFFVLIL